MQEVNDFLSDLIDKEYLWILEVFILVSFTLVAGFISTRFVSAIIDRAHLSKNHWDDAFLHSMRQPLRWLIWLLGLSLAAEIAAKQTDVSILALFSGLRHVAAIAIMAWFLVDFVARMEKNLVAPRPGKKPFDATTAMALGKLLRISIMITAVLVAMQSLGYSISGVLAFGGIGGIAVGFAAKDLLANFFGGLMIYLDRPFAVGDWVRSPDQNIEGTIEDIGWRLTRIRTFDKRPLYVPNSTFTQISVENPSRMTHRRIYETVGIRYNDAAKMAIIVEQVKSMIEQHKDLDMSQTVIVNFNKFSSSSLDFFIYCFTKTTNWIEYHGVKQDVLLQLIAIIERNDAQCAFPTSTVHIPESVHLDVPVAINGGESP